MTGDIAVVVEHLEGTIVEVSFELLGLARALARTGRGRVVAVLLGHGVEPLAAGLGAADRVLLCEAPALAHYTPDVYARVLAALLGPLGPRVTLVANTTAGMDQAAGLSGRLGWPLVAYCRAARIEDGRLVAVSQIYGGKILAEAEVAAPSAILSLLAGAAPAEAGREPRTPEVERIEMPNLPPPRIRFRRLIQPEAGDVDITREPVLVSVGRGVQSSDNLALVEGLAQALGGAVSASRPIVDQGWLPKSRQVGKSGASVKPKLYVALGISGAPEHLEGIRGAELVVAINTDPNAPIFGVAHYGVTADLFDVVPALTERLKAAR